MKRGATLKVQIYCDGDCRGNGQVNNIGGYGAVLICGDYIKKICGFMCDTTNNQMELLAVIKGLGALKRFDLEIEILVDSAYVCNGMNQWVHTWKKGNWYVAEQKKILNLPLWKMLDRMVEIVRERGGTVTFSKVKGHSGEKYNELADDLANYAMNNRINSMDVKAFNNI